MMNKLADEVINWAWTVAIIGLVAAFGYLCYVYINIVPALLIALFVWSIRCVVAANRGG